MHHFKVSEIVNHLLQGYYGPVIKLLAKLGILWDARFKVTNWTGKMDHRPFHDYLYIIQFKNTAKLGISWAIHSMVTNWTGKKAKKGRGGEGGGV